MADNDALQTHFCHECQRLLKENDDLKAQVTRWEDKEVERATCCMDNEEAARALAKALRDFLHAYVMWDPGRNTIKHVEAAEHAAREALAKYARE